MGRSLISPAAVSPKPMRFSSATQHSSLQANKGIASSFKTNVCCSVRPTRFFQIRAVLSEFPNTRKYPRVGAESTGSVPAAELLGIVELAAKSGAEVVMDAVNKPRNISYKGVSDLVTDTDKMSESVIVDVVRKNFEDHLILGEEGGLIGGTASDYLWCIDPLVFGGFDYQSEILHRHPSVSDSRNVEMLDQNMLFLRDLIARLDPSSVDSLDTFVADANTSLEFLAHFGLGEADLRYWEELCREAEYAVHRLRPLVTVRTGASLPDLRERVRVHREAVQRARDEFQQGTEDMRRYLQRSTTTSLQIEGISAKVKALWKEMKNLMSCKTDLLVEYDRQARVVARERARHQIRQQARASAEASLTRSTAELQAVEAEYQTFTEAVAQLRDLQTRLP